MPILDILLLVGVISLTLSTFIKGKSAIWGGATAGLIVGIILGVIKADLSDIIKAALIGADIGLLTEIIALAGNFLSKRSKY